jgi:hypothetical protein
MSEKEESPGNRLYPAWTDEDRESFLRHLVDTGGHVAVAAQRAGKTRKDALRERKYNPDFADSWDQAREEAIELLEGVAFELATKGRRTPIIRKGQIIDWEYIQDVRVLMFMLEAARPLVYRSRPPVGELSGEHVLSVELPDVMKKLAYVTGLASESVAPPDGFVSKADAE